MDNYLKNALVTESKDTEAINGRLVGEGMSRLLHSGIGLATESSEFLDALKKHIYYGKELDRVNLKEELGDLMWYCAIACDELGTDFETIMNTNIDKLKARFGDKFEESKAEHRNLNKEREILDRG